jgi:hypothetical protein
MLNKPANLYTSPRPSPAGDLGESLDGCTDDELSPIKRESSPVDPSTPKDGRNNQERMVGNDASYHQPSLAGSLFFNPSDLSPIPEIIEPPANPNTRVRQIWNNFGSESDEGLTESFPRLAATLSPDLALDALQRFVSGHHRINHPVNVPFSCGHLSPIETLDMALDKNIARNFQRNDVGPVLREVLE